MNVKLQHCFGEARNYILFNVTISWVFDQLRLPDLKSFKSFAVGMCIVLVVCSFGVRFE